MKKLITVFSLMAFIIVYADAQTIEKENKISHKTSWGIKAGINISNIVTSPSPQNINFSSLTGFTAGAFTVIPISHNFALQPELNFSSMGTKFSSTGSTASTSKMMLNYISIPVLLKYSNPKGGFGIYAGPEYALLTSAKEKSGEKSEDAKDSFKKSDFLAIAGIDYKFSVGFNLDLRYQLGLANIAEEHLPGESLKNNSLTITAGWVLPSKHKK
jgi:opacity protein-like surface antigen